MDIADDGRLLPNTIRTRIAQIGLRAKFLCRAIQGMLVIQMLPVRSTMLNTSLSIATDIPMPIGSPMVMSERREVEESRFVLLAPSSVTRTPFELLRNKH